MPIRKEVDITVTQGYTGEWVFTYVGKDLNVKRGNHVFFKCNKDFAAIFEKKKSPFTPKVLVISGQAGNWIGPYVAKKVSVKTSHKYAVAAYVGGSPPIAADDPHIIVDDDGGGPKQKSAKKKTTKKKAAKK